MGPVLKRLGRRGLSGRATVAMLFQSTRLAQLLLEVAIEVARFIEGAVTVLARLFRSRADPLDCF
jgi:hypothetical protein